jgi:hypothetical protein
MKKLSVVLLALVMAFAWTATAFAEATPYASVRFQTFYSSTDLNESGKDDVNNLTTDLFGTTRLGIKFKVSDEVSGLFEVNNAVGLRHAFGVWDFGAGKLLIGQTWTPYAFFAGEVFDDGAGGLVGSMATRLPQVRVTLDNGIYFGFMKTKISDSDDDVDFPALFAGYNGKAGDVTFGIGAAYQNNDADQKATQTGSSLTYELDDSYVVNAQVQVPAGPVVIKGYGFYGQNVESLAGSTGHDVINTYDNVALKTLVDAFGAGDYTLTDDVEVTSYGLILEGAVKASDKVKVVAGVGYLVQDPDVSGIDEDDKLVLYVNAPISVTKGFTVIPEIAYLDGMEDIAGDDDADTLYVGAKWQFDL